MSYVDYEVRQFADGRTMVVALPDGDADREMCDEVRATTWWSLEELRALHRHEFGGSVQFGYAWFIPAGGGAITIRPGVKSLPTVKAVG